MTDNLRTIALGGIKDHSYWLKTSASRLVHYIQLLVSRPDYETMAEDEMNEAEKSLLEALEKLREVKAAYQAKPVEKTDDRQQQV